MEKKFNIENLSKRNPYKVPEGYFESLTSRVMSQIPEDSASAKEPAVSKKKDKKVVGMIPHRRNTKWIKWGVAIAACVCGIALFLTNNPKEEEANTLASTTKKAEPKTSAPEEEFVDNTTAQPAKQYANSPYDISQRRKGSAYTPEPARNYQYTAYTPVERVETPVPAVRTTSVSTPVKQAPAAKTTVAKEVAPAAQPANSLAESLENMNDYDLLDYTQMSGSEIYDYLAGNDYY